VKWRIRVRRYLLPKYQVPEGYDLDGYLEKLAWDGLQEIYDEVTPEMR